MTKRLYRRYKIRKDKGKILKPLCECGAERGRSVSGRLYGKCHECANTSRQSWAQRNPERQALFQRKSRLKKYGMTPEDFNELLDAQDGKCAICFKFVLVSNYDPNRRTWGNLDLA